MMKWPFFLAVAFSVLGASMGLPQESAASPKLIKVAAIASLTGPAGEQGRNWLRGAELGIGELRNEGFEAELLVEDDATTPARAVSAFHKLTAVGGAQAVIGGTWDFLAAALYPLARKAEIPLILPTNPIEIVRADAPGNPWVFSAALSLGAEEEAMREFLVSEKPSSVAILWPDLPWGLLHATMMRSLAKELGIRVSFDQSFPMDTNYLDSIKVLCLKVREADPELLYTVIDYQGLALVMQETGRIRWNPLVLTTQHLDQAVRFTNAPDRFAKVYGVYPRAILDEQFKEVFRKQFGEDPRVYAAEGYDAVQIAVRGISAGAAWGSAGKRLGWRGVAGDYQLPADRGALTTPRAIVVRWGSAGLEPFAGKEPLSIKRD